MIYQELSTGQGLNKDYRECLRDNYSEVGSNVRYILNAISLVLSATALVLCTLRFRKRAKDSIHTDLEVEELKAERDSLLRENRILRAENSYLKSIHSQTSEKN